MAMLLAVHPKVVAVLVPSAPSPASAVWGGASGKPAAHTDPVCFTGIGQHRCGPRRRPGRPTRAPKLSQSQSSTSHASPLYNTSSVARLAAVGPDGIQGAAGAGSRYKRSSSSASMSSSPPPPFPRPFPPGREDVALALEFGLSFIAIQLSWPLSLGLLATAKHPVFVPCR